MVHEVRVLTSSYLPEYGTTTGGEIIVTTRAGGDQFHGGGFEYLRNKDLNALQFTNQPPRRRCASEGQRKRTRLYDRRTGELSLRAVHLGNQAQDLFLLEFGLFALARWRQPRSSPIPSCR